MNDTYDKLTQISKQRQEQLQKEAEDARRARSQMAESIPASNLVLARTGKIMAEIGQRLQERYGQDDTRAQSPVA